MKFKLNEDVKIGGTVISEGSIVEVIEEKDRVASKIIRKGSVTRVASNFIQGGREYGFTPFKDFTGPFIDISDGTIFTIIYGVNSEGSQAVYILLEHDDSEYVFLGTKKQVTDMANKAYESLSQYNPDIKSLIPTGFKSTSL